jgi:fused signal recognition particle receptor
MDELRKIRRTVAKFDSALPVETLLVIDAGTGRNALAQCGEFHAAIGVTGLALTKLDGTARGGVLLALARQYRIPVRYLGAGEGVDDLHEFDAAAFATALLDDTP